MCLDPTVLTNLATSVVSQNLFGRMVLLIMYYILNFSILRVCQQKTLEQKKTTLNPNKSGHIRTGPRWKSDYARRALLTPTRDARVPNPRARSSFHGDGETRLLVHLVEPQFSRNHRDRQPLRRNHLLEIEISNNS
jgi:hypothetical protein